MTTQSYAEGAWNDLKAFVQALGPHLDSMVLCGSFASLLYRFLPEAAEVETPPPFTLDHDWVLPRDFRDAADLARRIEVGGFVVISSRGDTPSKQFIQATRYGKEARAPVYGELLRPLKGGGEIQSVRLGSGLTAQQLP